MDQFKRASKKNWAAGISCGDGWNSRNYGHTKLRTKGRAKIRRAARMKLKTELRKEIY